MTNREHVNIVNDKGEKIGTYVLLDMGPMGYELHAYGLDGVRTGMASFQDGALIIKNAKNELGSFPTERTPPRAFAAQAAHTLITHGNQDPLVLGMELADEIANVERGQHKGGRGLGQQEDTK